MSNNKLTISSNKNKLTVESNSEFSFQEIDTDFDGLVNGVDFLAYYIIARNT